MVKFTNQSYEYPIAADSEGPHETGRTYISCDGNSGSWYDVGAGDQDDVAVRLRTSGTPPPTTPTPTPTTPPIRMIYLPLCLKKYPPPTATPTPTATSAVTPTPTATPTPTPTLPPTGVCILGNHSHYVDIIGYLHIVGEVKNDTATHLRFVKITANLFNRIVQRSPMVVKRFNGTVLVTSVGMFGSFAGWGIPLAAHMLCVTVGGIESKPVLHNGELQDREHLCLTVTFDHDIVDGAPAARLIQRFASLVQTGAGLDDDP